VPREPEDGEDWQVPLQEAIDESIRLGVPVQLPAGVYSFVKDRFRN